MPDHNQDRLLVIDDDPDICESITVMARKLGYEVRHEGEPFNAVSLAREWRPNVVITDLQMPGIDGIALSRKLAAELSTADFIIMSGVDQKLIGMASKLAADRGLRVAGTFQKPFPLAALADLLNKLTCAKLTPESVDRAIDLEEIVPFFQPKFDFASSSVTGVEALARWSRPGQKILTPNVFLPLVTTETLANKLFFHMLDKSLTGIASLPSLNLDVAINVDPLSLGNIDLPDIALEICRRRKIEPSRITFELTETASMRFDTTALDILARIRVHDFKLSIDDFGTGYSSLSRLRELPFTELKIDREFTHRILDDSASFVLVRSVIGMAKELSLQVVAEGVESQKILDELRKHGCDLAQGYHIGKPMPCPDLEKFVKM